MKVHFLAPHPLFGRKSAPRPVKDQLQSPYYWWWAYLRRSEAYLKCCKQGGKGKLAKIYADFGDVREDNFKKWWTANDKGASLFGEQRQQVKFGPMSDPSEWHPDWTTDVALVIAIPLSMSKRGIQSGIAKLLEQRIKSRRGRKALKDAESSARYPLARNYSARNLGKALEVYDLWKRGKINPDEKLKLWEIGVAASLNTLKKATCTDPHERMEIRNRLNAAVNRYVKEAQKHIAGVEKGVFPAV
jgi:hypothetical protein